MYRLCPQPSYYQLKCTAGVSKHAKSISACKNYNTLGWMGYSNRRPNWVLLLSAKKVIMSTDLTKQTMQNNKVKLSGLGESMLRISCSWLTGVELNAVFCCCSSFVKRCPQITWMSRSSVHKLFSIDFRAEQSKLSL